MSLQSGITFLGKDPNHLKLAEVYKMKNEIYLSQEYPKGVATFKQGQ